MSHRVGKHFLAFSDSATVFVIVVIIIIVDVVVSVSYWRKCFVARFFDYFNFVLVVFSTSDTNFHNVQVFTSSGTLVWICGR